MEFAIEALASAAVALRARTGSLRFDVDSLEPRMADIEEAKASGSLRLDFWREILVWLGFESWDCEEPESVSESESESEDSMSLFSSTGGRGEVSEAASVSASSSESARFTAGNSSSSGEGEAEGLE